MTKTNGEGRRRMDLDLDRPQWTDKNKTVKILRTP